MERNTRPVNHYRYSVRTYKIFWGTVIVKDDNLFETARRHRKVGRDVLEIKKYFKSATVLYCLKATAKGVLLSERNMTTKRAAAKERVDFDEKEFMEITTTDDVEIFTSFDSLGLKEDLLRGIYAYGKRYQELIIDFAQIFRVR